MSGSYSGEAWGVIPARGGSKSIPLKNMIPLGGRPLIEYVMRAGLSSSHLSRLLCSTENATIKEHCRRGGIEVWDRRDELCGDETPVLSVLLDILAHCDSTGQPQPDIIALLQPTSPFVLPSDIDAGVTMLRDDPDADSMQTISSFPHNFHAYNQRVIENGILRFRFVEERRECYNKQRKPVFYMFGNLLIVKVRTLKEQHDVFGANSLPRLVSYPYATDVDGLEDLQRAEWMLASGQVVLPHIEFPLI